VEAFERIKKIISEIDDDLQKAKGGNKAAGTRVRQAMQDLKDAAQEVRVAILEMRGSDKGDGKSDKKDAAS
jgi:signal transduction histidine kinase